MNLFISLIIAIPLIAFWIWMFHDMSSNADLPDASRGISWPPSSKLDWTIYFILLNIFAAIFYYFYLYKKD